MKIATCEQIRSMDKRAIEQYGIPGIVLMENAASAVVREMEARKLCGGRIVILCGKGNNGGDGYAVAWHLFRQGYDVVLVNVFSQTPKTEDAYTYYQIAKNIGIPFGELNEIDGADVIVDAIFGNGLKNELNDFCAAIVERINAACAYVVAVDLPSGMDADCAAQLNKPIRTDLTVTFVAGKKSLVFYPSALDAGELVVCDIGIPESCREQVAEVIDKQMIAAALPKRKKDSYKNSFGHVFVVAGSSGMTGAAALCAQAALQSGCGLVTLGIASSLQGILAQKLTEVMTYPLYDGQSGGLYKECATALCEFAAKSNTILFGPGLGRSEHIGYLLGELLRTARSPVVIDADGLNALAENIELLRETECEVVLTPHPGEMARLSGISVQEIEQDRISFALHYAVQHRVVLILKGARTVVATPGGRAYVCLWGNSGMATAGSGDVLAGVTASLLAQGISSEQAAFCAVGLHALAGDSAAESIGGAGVTAGDILNRVKYEIKKTVEVGKQSFKEV